MEKQVKQVKWLQQVIKGSRPKHYIGVKNGRKQITFERINKCV